MQANEFIANAEATEAVFRGDAEGIKSENQFPALAALPGAGALGRADYREAVALVRRLQFSCLSQHSLKIRRCTDSPAWQGCLEDTHGRSIVCKSPHMREQHVTACGLQDACFHRSVTKHVSRL